MLWITSGYGMAVSLICAQQLWLPVQDQASPHPGIDGLDNLQVPSLTEELLIVDKVGTILPYEDMANGRFPILQWMPLDKFTYEQH